MLRQYYALTKPGIIYGNSLSAAAGFLFAAALKDRYDLLLLLATLAGTALVIASGCVFNNYIDRGIDVKMARTKKRALVTGKISARSALIYATLLGIAGFLLLAMYTNPVTVGVGLVGFADYVVFYSFFKRRTMYGTIVGSISGATPIVAGYTAVVGGFDGGALLLFLIMAIWQMPHFYAIALYRGGDYAAAGIPVLPAVRGLRIAKLHIVAYIIAYIFALTALTIFNYTGYIFWIVMLGISLAWLRLALQGFAAKDSERWARKVFGFSLIVLLTLSAMLTVGAILP